MRTILHEDLKVFPHKRKKQLLPAQTVKKHLDGAQILLSCIEEGTLSNIVFSNKKKFNVGQHFNAQNDGEVKFPVVTRKQRSDSVMVWATFTGNGRSPLVFVKQGFKLKQENYQKDILEGSLLTWAQGHFKKCQWFFQQDSAPMHGAKKTQKWL